MQIVVNNCQRCGVTHDLDFKPLVNAVDSFKWWAACPSTGQPLLLAVTEDVKEDAQAHNEEVIHCTGEQIKEAFDLWNGSVEEHQKFDTKEHALYFTGLLRSVV